MARTEPALRCLRVLSRSVLCNDTLTTVESASVFSAAAARLQALAAAGMPSLQEAQLLTLK